MNITQAFPISIVWGFGRQRRGDMAVAAVKSHQDSPLVRLLGFWYLDFCWRLRILYCYLHPFIAYGFRDRKRLFSNDMLWVMRWSPLFSMGIPFFLEPWVLSDYYWKTDADGKQCYDRPHILRLLSDFVKAFTERSHWRFCVYKDWRGLFVAMTMLFFLEGLPTLALLFWIFGD